MFAQQGITENQRNGSIMLCLLTLLLVAGTILVVPSLSFSTEATLTDDAYTYSGSKATKYGTQSILSIRGAPGGPPLKRSFLKFDFTTLPGSLAGGDIEQATLKLFVRNLGTAGSFDIFSVAANWDETTITHQAAPSLGGIVASSVAVNDESIFVTVDLTALVRDWLNGNIRNYGIAILPNTEGINVDFDSKENTTTSHEPRLEIVLRSGNHMSGLVSFVPSFKACTQDGLSSCQTKSLVGVHLLGYPSGQEVFLDLIDVGLMVDGSPTVLEEIRHLEINKLPRFSGNGYEVFITITKGTGVSGTPHVIRVSPSAPVYSVASDPVCVDTPASCPLNVLVKLSSDSLLTLEVDPSALFVNTAESFGAIMSAQFQYDQGAREAAVKVIIWNAGEYKADYIITLTDCGPSKFEETAAQSRTLNVQETEALSFRLRASGPISAVTNECKVSLRSPSGRLYDSVVVRFDWPNIP